MVAAMVGCSHGIAMIATMGLLRLLPWDGYDCYYNCYHEMTIVATMIDCFHGIAMIAAMIAAMITTMITAMG